MVKPVAAALNAVNRVAQIRPPATLGDAYEDSAPWLERLVKGQSYVGHILARLPGNTFNVSIDGHAAPMTLPTEFEAGQTIRLQYLSGQPVPTFTLITPLDADESSSASLSKAAQLIDHYLQAAKHNATSAVFEAVLAVSNKPADAHQLAADLRHALVNSGLFYESHLAEFAQGSRALADVLQEAQNRDHSVAGSLLVKQLDILENQRLLWHGEIWPGQTMHWQLQLEDKGRRDNAFASANAPDEARPLSSSMTLHLPQLGKVNARIDLAHGSMRIMLSAEDAATAGRLDAARAELRSAIESNGQALAALAVVQHG